MNCHKRPTLQVLRLLFLLVAATTLNACVGPDSSERYARHFEPQPWADALTAELDDPWQWGPAATWLVLTPVALAFDSDIHDDAEDQSYITGGDTKSGDVLSIGLGLAPVLYGSLSWAGGDEGRALEASVESLLLVSATTDLLKLAMNRPRPEGNSNSSFPSGHTSFAFAGATLLARQIEEQTGSKGGYWFLLPATYVAVDRVEGTRHWASDVLFGAFLGTALSNWVWNAHFGDERRPGVFDRAQRVVWRPLALATDTGDLAFGVGLSW